jgi:hypothetical protein
MSAAAMPAPATAGGNGGPPSPVAIAPLSGASEAERPGFWGRLFGRRAKAPAIVPQGPGGPLSREVVVPVHLNADEAARGVTLRIRIVLTGEAGAPEVSRMSTGEIEIEREEIKAA